MSAEKHLSQYNVSVEQARSFIQANTGSPSTIFDVAKQYGVTSWMLAEIYGGISTTQVLRFFSDRGYNTTELDGDGVIHAIDFDNLSPGEYTVESFEKDLIDRYKYVHLDGQAEIINTDGNNQLAITSLGNEIEKSLQAVKMFDEQREVFFSYDVTFTSPFDWQIGKIPGIGAITDISAQIPTGGKSTDEAAGFSQRISFKEDGSANLYTYDQDRDEGYGTYREIVLNDENYLFQTDQVQHIEMYVRMNDPGISNGVVAVFINNQAAVSITDGNFLEDGITGINTLYLDFFHGGSISYAPEYDSTAIFDNLLISHLPSSTDLFLAL